jgi:hypothetical protein
MKRREVQERDNDGVADRRLELGGEVWVALDRLVRELLAQRDGDATRGPDSLELALRLERRGSQAGPGPFARQLVRQIDGLLDEAVLSSAHFKPGHAYCHRCDRADCEHSLPPSCRHVFVGYGPTGTPRWEDFAQDCLDLRHPQVDQLYDEPPALLTCIRRREELHVEMLGAFRNDRHELLAQLTAGFFPVRARLEEGRGVLALTAQVVAAKGARSRAQLALNLLGLTPAGEPLSLLWERQPELPWRRGTRWARAALQQVRGRRELERRALGILQGLARRLEREQRARARRTGHAELRHGSGARPTRNAVEDARVASPEELLVDERTGARIVLGDRGRTHFFTAEGQLVSSVRYSREAITRKLERALWRKASLPESQEFRAKLPG